MYSIRLLHLLLCPCSLLLIIREKQDSGSDMGKLRSGGHMRPLKLFNPAHQTWGNCRTIPKTFLQRCCRCFETFYPDFQDVDCAKYVAHLLAHRVMFPLFRLKLTMASRPVRRETSFIRTTRTTALSASMATRLMDSVTTTECASFVEN